MSDPEQQFVVTTKADGVGRITLNNPKRWNALNRQMIDQLREALERLEQDRELKCVVITGEGTAFCAGADISLFRELDNISAYDYMRNTGGQIQRLIENSEKIYIAAVNGMCLAGGLEIALCCDLVVASETAGFGLPEITLGILPGWGGTVRLPRRIPLCKAKEMILTGDFVFAKDALSMGLVNRVVPANQLEDCVTELTGKLCDKSPLALRMAKNCINNELSAPSIDAALAIERGSIVFLAGTEDAREGITAFLEKRKPVFKGQ
jgi:3-hydroxypropionyl-coenzyme A dehydratase